MFLNKDKQALVYLSQNQMIFYSGKNQQPLVLNIPKTLVADMEIKDPTQFITLLDQFLSQNKIENFNLVLLIGPSLSIKQNFAINPNQNTSDIAQFINNVPFDKVASLKLNGTKEIIMLAINEDYYNTVVAILSKHNCQTAHILPWEALQYLGLPVEHRFFDQKVVQLVLNNYHQLKDYSLPLRTHFFQPNQTIKQDLDKPIKPNNQRLFFLLGLFLVLLTILSFLIITGGYI